MSTASAMLATHPAELEVDADLLARAIDALVECAATCTQCADACLAEDDVADMRRCIRTDLDCADVCATTARVLARRTAADPTITRSVLEACATVCGTCADECAGHADHMDHCRICAETCRRCEQVCRELLSALPR